MASKKGQCDQHSSRGTEQLVQFLARNTAGLNFKTLTLCFLPGLVSASLHILQVGQKSRDYSY